jgi:hypothetical protein
LSPESFEWSPRMVRFPHPSLQTVNLLGQVLSSFIFASLMFGCVSQVGGGGGVAGCVAAVVHRQEAVRRAGVDCVRAHVL